VYIRSRITVYNMNKDVQQATGFRRSGTGIPTPPRPVQYEILPKKDMHDA